jgi:plasmid maintenance system antidote protein VapI
MTSALKPFEDLQRAPTNRLTGILNGRRAITGDTALRLAHFFGTSPEFRLCTNFGWPRRAGD